MISNCSVSNTDIFHKYEGIKTNCNFRGKANLIQILNGQKIIS